MRRQCLCSLHEQHAAGGDQGYHAAALASAAPTAAVAWPGRLDAVARGVRAPTSASKHGSTARACSLRTHTCALDHHLPIAPPHRSPSRTHSCSRTRLCSTSAAARESCPCSRQRCVVTLCVCVWVGVCVWGGGSGVSVCVRAPAMCVHVSLLAMLSRPPQRADPSLCARAPARRAPSTCMLSSAAASPTRPSRS